MATGIHVGHDKEAAAELRMAIMDVIHSPAADSVKLAAVKALSAVYGLNNVHVANNYISITDEKVGTSGEE